LLTFFSLYVSLNVAEVSFAKQKKSKLDTHMMLTGTKYKEAVLDPFQQLDLPIIWSLVRCIQLIWLWSMRKAWAYKNE
jgi:hypothetical protein